MLKKPIKENERSSYAGVEAQLKSAQISLNECNWT